MKNSTKRIALGTLVAGAMGYVAGILTAPKSGSETRGDIQAARTKGMAEAEKQLKKLHTELNELLGEAEDRAKKAADQLRADKDLDNALEGEVLGKATRTRQKAREILSALHDGNADDRDLDKAIVEAHKAIKSIRNYLKK